MSFKQELDILKRWRAVYHKIITPKFALEDLDAIIKRMDAIEEAMRPISFMNLPKLDLLTKKGERTN